MGIFRRNARCMEELHYAVYSAATAYKLWRHAVNFAQTGRSRRDGAAVRRYFPQTMRRAFAGIGGLPEFAPCILQSTLRTPCSSGRRRLPLRADAFRTSWAVGAQAGMDGVQPLSAVLRKHEKDIPARVEACAVEAYATWKGIVAIGMHACSAMIRGRWVSSLHASDKGVANAIFSDIYCT